VTLEEKTGMYGALGVHCFIESAIKEHQSQCGNLPHKIILGSLEWKLLGLDHQDDFYINDVLLACNSNVESGMVLVEEKNRE